MKCDKEIRGALNVIKVQSHVMFALHNVRTVSSNVRKKIKVPTVRKVLSNVMLVLPNVTIEPSFVIK